MTNESVYNDGANKLKKLIKQILKHKVAKFLADNTTPVSKKKLEICDKVAKFLKSQSKDDYIIHELMKFQVEFSELIMLMNKYIRSINLDNYQSLVLSKMRIENKVPNVMSTFNSPKTATASRNKNGVNRITLNSYSSSIQNTTLINNLHGSGKPRILEMTSQRRSNRNNTLAQSKSIRSWLESEIDRAKKFLPTPKKYQVRSIFSPLQSKQRKYISPKPMLNSSIMNSRNMSINSTFNS